MKSSASELGLSSQKQPLSQSFSVINWESGEKVEPKSDCSWLKKEPYRFKFKIDKKLELKVRIGFLYLEINYCLAHKTII